MRIKHEPLFKYTTFKIGGPAEFFSMPESEEELIAEIKYCISKNIKWRILGNGSNLLINDKGIKGFVICNKKACTQIKLVNDDIVEVGSSVMLPRFVQYCVNNGLGGNEYLCSIPGTVGGAIYMNAGRGRKHNLSISNSLKSVRIFDGKDIIEIPRKDLYFGYRSSVFQTHQNWTILSATFKLPKQDKKIGQKKIAERIEFVENSQNRRYPNAGSIFKKYSKNGLRLINGLRIGDARINGNWISNLGQATYSDIIFLIKVAIFMQYLMFTKPALEIEIWK